MKTSRVTRRVVRRWALRIRGMESIDLVSVIRLGMPERERDVVGALIIRELSRRDRRFIAEERADEGYPCSVDGKPCPCGFDSPDCR